MPFEIKNRSVLKLRHKTSGKYLYSGGFLYPQAGSSRQQAVGASGNLDQTAEWFVKESHGTLGAPDLNNRFYDQNVIRLEHVSSTKNLHSHQGLQYSPIQGHHEVTCFGSLGEGDGNDDWQIQVVSEADPKAIEVRLKHVPTGWMLCSIGAAFNSAPKSETAYVTTVPDPQSSHTLWVLEPSEPARQVATTPLILLDFGTQAAGIALYRLDEFDIWYKAERERWKWLWEPAAMQSAGTIAGQIDNFYGRIIEAFSAARQRIDTNDLGNALRAFEKIVAAIYGQNKLLHSNDPRARFVLELAKIAPAEAAFALGAFVRIESNSASQSASRGQFAALSFEQGLRGNSDEHRASSATFILALKKEIEELRAETQRFKSQASLELSLASGNVKDVTDLAAASVAEAKADFDAVQTAIRKEWPIQASVVYWRKKGYYHVVIGAAMAVGVYLATWFAYDQIADEFRRLTTAQMLFKAGSSKPATVAIAAGEVPYLALTVSAIALTVAIWALRIFVKLVLSNIQQASDAFERVTMIKTFIALLGEGRVTDEQDKGFILNTLFRPGQTGLLSDDGSPATPMEILNKRMSG